MPLFSWLFAKAPTHETPAPTMPAPASRPQRSTPKTSEPDEPLPDGQSADPIDLEEVFCTIDYCDASGEETRRRITMRNLRQGPNAPVLTAVCHERRAIRHFRCDRIICFIEDDGEVVETQAFFLDTLNIDINRYRPDENAAKALENARTFREHLRPALSVLVLAARSDDEFHPEELDIICQYVEGEALADDVIGPDIGLDELNALTPMIRKMRPQASSLPGYLRKIHYYDESRFDRFEDALRQLIQADGKITLGEEAFLADIRYLRNQIDEEAERELARL